MQVTILTSRHVTDYKTSESTGSLPSPFLKALHTKNFEDQLCCSLLEQPNIVHDLPAAGEPLLHRQSLFSFDVTCAGKWLRVLHYALCTC